MAYNFEYYAPTRVYFGRGEEKNTGRYIRRYGAQNVMLVYGGSSAGRSGLLDLIRQSLRDENIAFSEIGGVVPNPHLDKVYEGISLGRKNGTDFLLAVGGGSAIDTAKAIAYGLAEPEQDVWELYEHTRKAKKCLPVAGVLTIAAAGSETSKGSVITNEKTGSKRAYDDNLARPVFAIMNPEYTVTLPDYQTEAGCVDIMMHTMERYLNQAENMELTDGISECLIRTVMKNAGILLEDPRNYEARAEVMWAGSLSHNGLTGCGTDGGDWASHQLEHELGGMYDVAHGAGLAAVWGSWARYVMDARPERFARFAVQVMGVKDTGDAMETAEKGVQAMEEFYRSIQMPTSLRELGVEPGEEELRELARKCSFDGGRTIGCVKKLDQEDIYRIYQNAR